MPAGPADTWVPGCGPFLRRLLGEPEDALAHDVSLHLGGTTPDSDRAGGQEIHLPLVGPVRSGVVVGHDHGVGATNAHDDLAEPLGVLRPEHLVDRRSRPRLLL